jgi:hypothetical protein
MKRYQLVDNKTGDKFSYSKLEWNIAFLFIFLIGILIGIFLK